jgi:hypothetical protein
MESSEDKSKLDDLKNKWLKDIENVDKIIGFVQKKETNSKIEKLAQKILADPNQITTFMSYN